MSQKVDKCHGMKQSESKADQISQRVSLLQCILCGTNVVDQRFSFCMCMYYLFYDRSKLNDFYEMQVPICLPYIEGLYAGSEYMCYKSENMHIAIDTSIS